MADSYNELFGLGTYAADANLQGHWLLQDDAASTVVIDDTGSNNGTLNGGDNTADLATTGPGGWVSSALDLDGTSDYISMGNVLDLQSSSLTVGIKAKPTSAGQTAGMMGRDNGTANTSYTLIQVSNTYQFRISANKENTVAVTSSGVPNSSSFQDVTGIYDGTRLYVRVNGTTYTGNTNSGNIRSKSVDFELGSRNGGLIPFDGDLAHAFVFNRNLTEAESDEAHAGPEPLNISAPSVTGTHETGETLSSSTGSWDSQSNGTITYTYQWQTATDAFGAGLADISGATSSSYTLTASEEGLYVRCLVRGSNDGGHDAAEDTGSVFTLASAGSGGGPSSDGFPFVIYYRGAACV